MNIRRKLLLIVIASILVTVLPGGALIYQYAQRNMLATQTESLEVVTGWFANAVVQQFARSGPKLKALADQLEPELGRAMQAEELQAFDRMAQLNSDGVWRNRLPGFDGAKEAGLFLPEGDGLSPAQKVQHLRIKQRMDQFGPAASAQSENLWYLSPQRSEIIFDRTYPHFAFDQKADNDYTQTPWVTLSTPQKNPQHELRFTPALYDPVPKVWMVSAVLPLYVKGQWAGSLGEDMPLAGLFDKLLAQKGMYAGVQHFLLDREGNFILAGPWQSELESAAVAFRPDLTHEPQLAKLLASVVGVKPTALGGDIVFNGQRYLAIGTKLDPLGWQYFRLLPVDQVKGPLQRLFVMLGAMALLVTAATGVLIGTAVGRNITQRIRLLRDVMQAYAHNNTLRVNAAQAGTDEIGQVMLAYNALADSVDHNIAARVQAQAVLASNEELWRLALEGAGHGVWDWNLVQDTVSFSPLSQSMLDLPAYLPKDGSRAWFSRVHPDDKSEAMKQIQAYLSGEIPSYAGEYRVRCRDGSYKWVLNRGQIASRDASGNPVRALGTQTDVTDRKLAEEDLKLAASVFSHAREGIMITKADGTIVNINEAFVRITGYTRDDVMGQNPRILNSGRHPKPFYTELWRDLLAQGFWYGEVWNRRKTGEVYAEMQTISVVRDARGQPQHYVSLFSDITASKEHQQQLEHIAHFDALTNLPNRVLLADRLHQAVNQCQRRGQLLAVAYLDLDGFKGINDSFGHDAGDQLLMAVSARMRDSLRDGDTLARIGGDEFVAVLVDLSDVASCEPLLARLLAAASQPLLVGELTLQVSASLGVTFYPQPDDVEAEQLLRQADQAMYQAKMAGKNRYHVFNIDHDRSVRGHHESLDHIRHALDQQEFVLHYQPKVNMRNGQVIGAEALIRWQHPQQGLLTPSVFLPVIENDPLAVDIGEWVIHTALTQMDLWHTQGLDLPVSVNVGARQLQQPNFVTWLAQTLAQHPHIRPSCLELEILETSALSDMAGVSQVIEACRAMGVMFALDDFGTGYSSLTYLKRLPVTLLKIDQSFVRDMLADPDDLAILQGVIGLARAFRREVIAEGVETRAHGDRLLELGCDLAQGYGIARPMPAADMPGWVTRWRAGALWLA